MSDEHELSDERVARAHREFAFHHSLGRPTITFRVKGCFGELKNLHFTTVLGVRRSLFALRVASASSRICISPTVLGVRRALFALRVARRREKFAFHHSFGRPTSTFCVKGRSAT